jgi:hypothetical protein
MSLLRHIAFSLHAPGSREKLMALVTSYMDETGHSDDPSFRFAGMAGFVAPIDLWEKFGKTWQEILDIFNLKEPFHMKDFAHSVGQFKEWKNKETKRQLLFKTLVQLIVKIDAIPIGAIVSLDDFETLSERQRTMLLDPYYVAFQTCTRGAAIVAAAYPHEKAVMVYSYNKEFGATKPQEVYSVDQAGRAEQLWHAMKNSTDFGRWMGAYSSGSPAEIVQLQAADLFAYELAKEFQNLICRPDDNMRWGLRQILPLVTNPWPMIRLFDRKELLRLIIEGNLPYKEGTEEVSDVDEQLKSEHRKRSEWLKRRAGVEISEYDLS